LRRYAFGHAVNKTTGETIWKNTFFDHLGKLFTDRIPINGTEADHLEIKNEATSQSTFQAM
jgi:hypothetical protein